jgi:hypothetical protein
MDIADKHKELILCSGTGAVRLPVTMQVIAQSYQRDHPGFTPAQLANMLEPYGELVPQISFTNFGGRDIEPVVQGLTQLYNAVVRVVREFMLHI